MNFKISKLRKFKNIEGNYAFINQPLKTTFTSDVVFDVKFNELKPVLMVNLTNQIENYITELKEAVISEVYKKKIYQMSKEELTDFFVSPIKTVKKGKKLVSVLKLKITDPEINNLPRKTKVNLEVTVSSLWFNDTSFGVYLNVEKVNVINEPKKCLLVDTSDTESEINLKI
jgi:hypothetical protein